MHTKSCACYAVGVKCCRLTYDFPAPTSSPSFGYPAVEKNQIDVVSVRFHKRKFVLLEFFVVGADKMAVCTEREEGEREGGGERNGKETTNQKHINENK